MKIMRNKNDKRLFLRKIGLELKKSMQETSNIASDNAEYQIALKKLKKIMYLPKVEYTIRSIYSEWEEFIGAPSLKHWVENTDWACLHLPPTRLVLEIIEGRFEEILLEEVKFICKAVSNGYNFDEISDMVLAKFGDILIVINDDKNIKMRINSGKPDEYGMYHESSEWIRRGSVIFDDLSILINSNFTNKNIHIASDEVMNEKLILAYSGMKKWKGHKEDELISQLIRNLPVSESFLREHNVIDYRPYNILYRQKITERFATEILRAMKKDCSKELYVRRAGLLTRNIYFKPSEEFIDEHRDIYEAEFKYSEYLNSYLEG